MGYGSYNLGMQNNASQTSANSGPLSVGDRMPLIALEMDRQAKALVQLHDIIGNMESRLSGVLRVVPPDVASAGPGVPVPAVPLAGNLSEQNQQIESAIARLRGIFERVEL